jgi:hypothetical protein
MRILIEVTVLNVASVGVHTVIEVKKYVVTLLSKIVRYSVFVLFGVWDREAPTGHLIYKHVCTVATSFTLKCYSRVFKA